MLQQLLEYYDDISYCVDHLSHGRYEASVVSKPIIMTADVIASLQKLVLALGTNEFPICISHLLKNLVPFDSCIFIAYQKGRKPWSCFRETSTPDFHQTVDRQYLSSAYLLDPAYQLHLSGAPDGAYRIADIAPDHFKQSEYYKSYYKMTNVVDEMVFMCKLSNGSTMTLCVVRDGEFPKDYDEDEIDIFCSVSGIIIELIKKHWSQKFLDAGELESRGDDLIHELQSCAKYSKGVELTYRQSEVACLIMKGYSNRAIADIMKVSYETVKVFRKQLYSRCNISSQSELFAFFISVLS